jgi:O-acetylhomoserine/O-acetylserine sulfhydrylase-like pyridoxal-dependent enzyme
MKLETLLIHAGAEIDRATGSVSPPINLSTTFEHGPEAGRICPKRWHETYSTLF